ncbi:MAG: Glycosyl transferase family 2 [Microgenomates group bacterium GW2011_GWF2_47_9]|nr:MAG: Glycosyl transferase family 2 [Microgenomates group bacterium GW2011_GWF2_47_9]
MKKITVTIGIPAYNEEKNIAKLLASIYAQKETTWVLQKVIVYSDGSSDRTAKIVSRDKRVTLITSLRRRGVSFAQNKIIKSANSDILVLLDADVLPAGNLFVTRLIAPFHTDPLLGMTSARPVPLGATSFFSQVINWSHEVKTHLYEAHPHSIYLVHGRARALSHGFYTKLRFPGLIAEDAYSYLACSQLGFGIQYMATARVIFRSPTNLRDHLMQSSRYFDGRLELAQFFPQLLITRSYKLSLALVTTAWLKALFQKPGLTVSYLAVLAYSRLVNLAHPLPQQKTWEPSTSSKSL